MEDLLLSLPLFYHFHFIETTKKQIKGKGKDLLFTIIYYYFFKKGSL